MLDCSTSLDAFLKSVRKKKLVNKREGTSNLRVVAVLHATSKRLLMERKKSKRSMLLENDENEENDENTSPKRKRVEFDRPEFDVKSSERKDVFGLQNRNSDDGANLFIPHIKNTDEGYDVKRFDDQMDFDDDDENEIVDIETPDDDFSFPCTMVAETDLHSKTSFWDELNHLEDILKQIDRTMSNNDRSCEVKLDLGCGEEVLGYT